MNCDILIVGAGVAGLCAAIASARQKLSTILIEKESEIGLKIKGECIQKKDPIFEKIFGKGLPDDVILNELTSRRIYSPSANKYMELANQDPLVSIDYRLFIVELFKELAKTNCTILLNTKLIDIIKENEKVIGAICKKGLDEIQINSKYIIAADGNNSKISSILNIFSQKEIYHSLKFNYENLNVPDHDRIELYLMTNPPGAMWMFPKGPTSGEAGIVTWTHDLPSVFDIMELWEKKSKEHKILKNIIKDAKAYYVSRDFLNFGGPIKNLFGNGVAFVGDAGGHVGAVGAAGIISSMTTGFDVSEFISKSLLVEENVTDGMIKEFLNKYKRSPIQKFLKNEQSAGITIRNILFENFKTADTIDENWEKLKNLVENTSIA